MATFSYIAKRPDGAETRGTIDAASVDAAREELRKQGLMIDDIRQVGQPRVVVQQPRTGQQRQQASSPAPTPPRQPPRPPQPSTAPRPPAPQAASVVQASRTPKPGKPEPLPWSGAQNGAAPKMPEKPEYAPLHETLRVFAGWLLGWYGVIYALGFLEQMGKLPDLPFVHELFVSPLVLQFTFGTFLLLALSNLHRWLGKGILLGFFLTIIYAALLAGFVVYG